MKKINQQNNLSIFDCFYPNFKIEKPIRLIELFAGYGSQALSLKYLGINFQHYFVSEIDKYAIDTYNKFNNTNFETCDIKNIHAEDLNIIETNKYNYILTYSFPCTDLSLAGKREGMEKGSGTRSSLLFEVERILKEIKDSNKELPQVLLMENVPQVLTSKGWDQWYFFLESLGYKNYIEILNSKHFYIPQNRERCFMVSILGNYNYNFPKHVKLKYLLKDYLEENVDEKYYLSEKMIKCFLGMNKKRINFPRKEIFLRCLENTNIKGIATTITTRVGQRPTDNFILIPEKTKLGYAIAEEGDGVYINRPHQKRGVVKVGNYSPSGHNAASIVDSNGLSPTVMGNHGTVTAIIENDLKPKLLGGIGEKKSNNGTQYYQQNRVYSGDGIAMCHPANLPGGSYYYNFNLRIRKLTPKECYRLMGVKDEEINKVTVSNAQQYKQAGNSIVISVLMAIFGELLDIDYETKIKQIYDYQK